MQEQLTKVKENERRISERCQELESIVAKQQELLLKATTITTAIPTTSQVQSFSSHSLPAKEPSQDDQEELKQSAMSAELLAQCEFQAHRSSKLENALRKTEEYVLCS